MPIQMKTRILLLLVSLLPVYMLAAGEKVEKASDQSAAPHSDAVELSTVEFAGKRFTVCRVDVRKERLQLFHRDDTGKPYKRFGRLASWLESRGQKLVFAMNAGMYHGDFSAVGLFVSGGRQAVPLNTADGRGNFFLKPNGVFVVTESGARVLEASEYPE